MPSRFRQSLPHECDACRLRFRSRLKLLKHRQSHRAVYTCNECGYASRFRTYVKNHWLMHKGTTYTCPYCQIVYNHQTSYYNHIRIQHPGENEACYECGETFAAGRGMNLHKALAHRTSDKSNAKHKCKDCGVKFLNAEALQRHEELGAGVPHAALWPCAACGDSCGSDTALKAHAAEQHTDRHHCDECNKTFLNSESFELHVQRKHMNKRAVEGPFRPRVGVGRRQPCVYVCEICGKVFKNSTLLQYHMNGHLAVKPFQCKQCPKTFPRQGALNLHMRVHTGRAAVSV
ncbi:zinc finger Y-chromosomal protein-like [Choristoneura fumiferana]|uniref:zinc finger Y-chromosomal protein-like n=1 Tax=Choristoneura fumiferana TaxID=7141 RepID=UPI003D15E29F